MHRTFFLTFLTLCVGLIVSCDPKPEPEPEYNLSLSAVTLQLKVGDISTIEVLGNAVDIQWTSSNEEVASVYHGVVTANAIGAATITAKAGKSQATCIVYVSGTDGATLRITPPVVTLRPGEKYTFSYGNTFDLEMTWTSSKPEVATVSNTGEVTALAAGNTTITLATPLESVTALVAVEHTWGDYQLVWSDEFDGTALDESVWGYNTGGSGIYFRSSIDEE